MSPQLIITLIFLSGTVAALYTYYQKRILGDLLRALSKKGAVSPGTSLPINGLCGNRVKDIIASLSLYEGSVMRKYVGCCEDIAGKSYYIIEDNSEEALKRYNGNSTSFVTVIVCVIVLGIFAFAASYIVPAALNLLGYGNDNYVPDDYIAGEELADDAKEEDESNGEVTQEPDGTRFDVVG